LGFNDEKINVFGSAYHSYALEKNDMRGLDQDMSFKVGNTIFGV
jgi:hypothetical protein